MSEKSSLLSTSWTAMSVSRYHLPFVTATHHTCSPWSGKSHDDQSQSSLLTGLPAEALRIAWNVAWHDGIEEAITGRNSSPDRYHGTCLCCRQAVASHLRHGGYVLISICLSVYLLAVSHNNSGLILTKFSGKLAREEEEEFILQTCIQNYNQKKHVMDGYQKGHMAIQAGSLKKQIIIT